MPTATRCSRRTAPSANGSVVDAPEALLNLPPTIAWHGGPDGRLELLDQTRLPDTIALVQPQDLEEVVDAIRRLAVRGAPAIGVAAAYGLVLGMRRALAAGRPFAPALAQLAELAIGARPTAVNLGWAVRRLQARAAREPSLPALLAEARAIHSEDTAACAAIGRHGAELVPEGGTVLTHCNAGRLATAGEGTALAPLYEAWRRGTRFRVLADETRPLLQGARLTALELRAAGIPVEVIADSAAAGLIARGEVTLVVTGADRIAANGDVANKVGTYGLALAAAAHGVPMYVAAPASTFDVDTPDGSRIEIEQRDPDEILHCGDRRIAAAATAARNPAFDITPARLLRGLVTDRGLISPVTEARIKLALG